MRIVLALAIAAYLTFPVRAAECPAPVLDPAKPFDEDARLRQRLQRFQQDIHPIIRPILLEAEAHGLDPEMLYTQAVQARPPHWPVAPSFEEVMSSGDARPTRAPSAITRERAFEIATEHLRRVPGFEGAKIRQIVAWDEIVWRRPNVFNVPPCVEDSWVAYLQSPNEATTVRSSRIIVMSHQSGAVLFTGDASDEG